MACRYTYKGKTYELSAFDDLLRAMPPSEAAAFMPTVQSVPDAPMIGKTDAWVSLALKRVIKMAVDGGYDKVAFVTGEQSAERYDLSKQIDRIEITPRSNADGTPAGKSILIVIANKASDMRLGVGASGVIDNQRGADASMIGKPLDDVIGKELAQRVMDMDRGTLDGEGLKIGGEGMRAFYDKIVPTVAKDVLRKVGGGAMETVQISLDHDAGSNDMKDWSGADGAVLRVLRNGGEIYVSQRGNENLIRNEADLKEYLADNGTPDGYFLGDKQGSATQPGFTITDAMREKASGGMPLFNIQRTRREAGWAMPGTSRFDDYVYKFQDKQIDLRRAIGAITAQRQELEDRWDAYLQEELFHGRAAKRTQDFVNNELQPLLRDMAARGISIDKLDDYLHARHAEEANELIAERNRRDDEGQLDLDGNVIESPLQDGGSGMLTADARAYLAGLDPAEKRRLEAVAAKVDAIITKTREMYAGYGLESQATVDGWGAMFENYVPLMREDHDGGMGIGQGFSIKGRESKHRTGSTAKVVDILGNIALQRERAIVRGEKNRVAVAMAGLVKTNPAPDFWQFDKVPTEQVLNEATGKVDTREIPGFKSRPNVMVAKITDSNGNVHERAIVFNERNERAMRMVTALKNLDAAQLEGLIGVSAKITRYFAAVNTQYNPVFGVVNLVRDVQGAAINLTSTEIKGHEADVLKHVMPALLGTYVDARKQRKGAVNNTEWSRLWEEFQNEGGATGFRDLYRTSEDRADAIRDALDPTRWMQSPLGKVFTAGGTLKVPMAVAQKSAGWLFDWLSDYNLAMENSVRLAAYKVGLEQGLSKQRAASLAKNLTVNFNRKGQIGQQAGALYAFFNASVQGTARMGQVLFDTKNGQSIKLTSLGAKIIGGGIMLGAIQAMMLAAAGFGDDEPPQFVRERSLVIPTGLATGKKDYIAIPMPLGWHVLPNIGRVAVEFAMSGFKEPGKRAAHLAAVFADSFNPIGNAGLSLQTITPTALDPMVALAENRDWTGKPIARESFNKATPGHQLAKDTASSPARWISEAINWASGGTKYKAGAMSPTPDQIDYLWGQVTGGVGREISKVDQTIGSMITGEELPPHKIPLVGRFYGNAESASSQGARFYENVNRLNLHEAEVKGLAKDGLKDEIKTYRAANPDAALIALGNASEQRVQNLRKRKRELLAKEAPRSEIKKIEDEITKAMKHLNDAVEEARKKEPA